MRRHSLIARLGPADTAPVAVVQRDSLRTEIRFVDGYRQLGYGIGQMVDQLTSLGLTPSETAADLAILAALVTAGDTRISRLADSQDTWTREIDLYLPVHELARWEALAPLVVRILNFLTGDRWRLFLRARNARNRQLIVPRRVRVAPPYSSVCLFSGGLDSFVGAIDLLAVGQRPLLVSHY